MIVIGYVPAAAPLPAVNVKVLVVAVLIGLKDAVTPLGMPVAVKPTLPVKVLLPVTVMALVPLAPPAVMVTLPLDERVKLGVAVVAGVMTKLLE